MKTRYQMTRPLGDLINKAVREKELMPSKSWSQFDDIEASFYARQRPAPAPAPAPAQIAVTLRPVETLETRFPLPYNPPRYEKGKEISRWIPCMKITCGPLSYRIIKKTDGGRVMAIAQKLKRLATPLTLEAFIQDALEYIDEKPNAPARPAHGWSTPSSGISVKQRKGANATELGTTCIHPDKSASGESLVTLTDAFKASAAVRKAIAPSPAAVRKALAPSRRRKAA